MFKKLSFLFPVVIAFLLIGALHQSIKAQDDGAPITLSAPFQNAYVYGVLNYNGADYLGYFNSDGKLYSTIKENIDITADGTFCVDGQFYNFTYLNPSLILRSYTTDWVGRTAKVNTVATYSADTISKYNLPVSTESYVTDGHNIFFYRSELNEATGQVENWLYGLDIVTGASYKALQLPGYGQYNNNNNPPSQANTGGIFSDGKKSFNIYYADVLQVATFGYSRFKLLISQNITYTSPSSIVYSGSGSWYDFRYSAVYPSADKSIYSVNPDGNIYKVVSGTNGVQVSSVGTIDPGVFMIKRLFQCNMQTPATIQPLNPLPLIPDQPITPTVAPPIIPPAPGPSAQGNHNLTDPSEVATGDTWKGKPVYRRNLTGVASQAAYKTDKIATGIDQVIDVVGYFYMIDSNNHYSAIEFDSNGAQLYSQENGKEDNQLLLYLPPSVQRRNYEITVYYTKK
jgi:hypothetical protein